LQVGNTHATRRAILFKNLNYILKEIYDILSEDALNYPVQSLFTLYRDLTRAFYTICMVWRNLHNTIGSDELGLKFSRLSATPTVTDHPDTVPDLIEGGGSSESSVYTFQCFSRRNS